MDRHARHRRAQAPAAAAPHSAAPAQQDKQALRNAGALAIERIARDQAPSRSKLELCKRPADLAVIGRLVDHWWIRGQGFEAGMGLNDCHETVKDALDACIIPTPVELAPPMASEARDARVTIGE